jgi:hypothetical protein
MLSGCTDTLVNPEERDLAVPQIGSDSTLSPLRIAFYVPPSVIKDARMYTEGHGDPLNPTKYWGNIGPSIVKSFALESPKTFSKAYLAARFPNPQISPSKLDAVLVVEDAIGELGGGAVLSFKGYIDTSLALAVYAIDGELITKYTVVASAEEQFSFAATGSQASQQTLADSDLSVPATVRKALLQFPSATVTSYLASNKTQIVQTLGSATPEFWQTRDAALKSEIETAQARDPKDAYNGAKWQATVDTVSAVSDAAFGLASAGAAVALAAKGGIAIHGLSAAQNVAVNALIDDALTGVQMYAASNALPQESDGLIPLSRATTPAVADAPPTKSANVAMDVGNNPN